MTLRHPARLAIHRRSDEIDFLQRRFRDLGTDPVISTLAERQDQTAGQTLAAFRSRHDSSVKDPALQRAAIMRERDLADELMHTRQIEPLGETLQRRLAMAERVCRDLASVKLSSDGDSGQANNQSRLPDACWVAEVERRAVSNMLEHWWAWLRKS